MKEQRIIFWFWQLTIAFVSNPISITNTMSVFLAYILPKFSNLFLFLLNRLGFFSWNMKKKAIIKTLKIIIKSNRKTEKLCFDQRLLFINRKRETLKLILLKMKKNLLRAR